MAILLSMTRISPRRDSFRSGLERQDKKRGFLRGKTLEGLYAGKSPLSAKNNDLFMPYFPGLSGFQQKVT